MSESLLEQQLAGNISRRRLLSAAPVHSAL